MTFQEMLNQALSEIGFKTYTDFFGSTKAEARQLISLGNRELNTYKKDDWQELRQEWSFTMTDSELYPLPPGFREFLPNTAWSSTRRVDFPVTSEVWTYYRARNISNGLRHRMRRYQDQLQIQNPQNGAVILMQYISDSPVLNNQLVPKPKFTANDDTLLLNDDLFIMGVKWRFMKVKGLDWQEDYAEYRNMYKRERSSNLGAQTIETIHGHETPPYEPHADLYV